MNCPSCGAQIEADSRFAYMVVCESCDSSVVLDARAAHVAGKMSTLKPPSGVLYTGATGTLGEQEFRVLGRVRYGYGQGLWDEWFVSLEDGDCVWVSEDEDDLTVETYVHLPGTSFGHDFLEPGDRIRLGQEGFTVTEKDVATCEGGEGQLPFMIVPGERVPFLDLTGDDRFGTVEFEDDGVRVFVGKRISPERIELDRTRQEAGIGSDWMSAERGEGMGGRARIVKGAGGAATLSLKCTSCGSPQEFPDEGATSHECGYCGAEIDLTARQIDCPQCDQVIAVKTADAALSVVCPKCRHQLDLSRDTPTVLASLADKKRPRVPLKLGKKGKLEDVEYEVVGHIRFVERSMWGTYFSDEFFLRPQEGPPRWLVLEDGHWAFGGEVTGQPVGLSHPRHAIQQTTFAFGSGDAARTYKVFDQSESPNTIEYVEGELPWVAQIGDQTQYMDAICPPYILSAEWSSRELEWFLAEYISPEEVAEAFGLSETNFPEPDGISPCQPYEESEFYSESTIVVAFFALLSIFFLMNSFGAGNEVASLRVPLSELQNDQEFVTQEFDILQAPGVIQAKVSCPVDNAWVYAQMALIDSEDRALLDFDGEMSYYHGYEGGESWSEGSTYDSTVFRVDEPGAYKLLVAAKGGTGNNAAGLPLRAGGLQILVYDGVELTRYYLFFSLVLGAMALWMGSAKIRFETKRWSKVLDDDDD